MKKKLLKSMRVLLVAVWLCTGANASWAQTYNQAWSNDCSATTGWGTHGTKSETITIVTSETTDAVQGISSNYINFKTANGKDRSNYFNLATANANISTAIDWKFEFDAAIYGSNSSSHLAHLILQATNSESTTVNLFSIDCTSFNTFQLNAAGGTGISKQALDVTSYASGTRDKVGQATNWYHFTVISNAANGTTLTVEKWNADKITKATPLINAVKIYNGLVNLTELQVNGGSYQQWSVDELVFSKAVNPVVTTHFQLSNGTTLMDDVETEVASGNSFTPSYPASFRSGTTQYTYASGGDEIASVTSDTEVTIVYNSTAMPEGTFYAETYEKNGGTTGWATSNGSDHAPVIVTNGLNKYLTCENLYHNARTVTGNVVNQAVGKNTDFTMTFDLQLKSQTSDNTCALTFNDYDNQLSMLRFLGSPNSTTWTINDNVDQTVTLTAETWYTVAYSRKGSLTYLTITPTAGGDAVFAQNTISTLSTDGGLGNITFSTGRHDSNFALDNVLVRAWQSGDTPEVTETTYTIKYQDSEGTTLKDDVVNATTVGTEDIVASTGELASFYNDGRTKKYIYQSGNTPITAVANAASNVITLVFREAATYNYTVTTNQGTVLANTSDFEAETIYQPYPRYDLKNGVMYEKGAISNEYRQQFNLTENNQAVLVDGYSNSGISNVVYYIEGENIEGVSVTTDGTISTRSSNAAAGLRNDADRTIYSNLAPGKYKIFVAYNRTSGTASNTFTVDGQNIVLSVGSGSNMVTTNSDEITVSSTSDVVWSDGASPLDYIYIQKVGDIVSFTLGAESGDSYKSYVTIGNTDFATLGVTAYIAKAANTANGTVTLSTIDTAPAGVPVLLKGTKGEYATITTTSTSYDAPETNYLVAANGSTSIGASDAKYVLAYNDKWEFRHYNGTLSAGKVYLDLSALGARATTFNFVFDDVAAGISTVQGETNDANGFYNLNGQRVNQAAKGLYIMNGKKVIIK